ncbi:MAG: hypothetical protein F6K04_15170 [Leptolyngbya sp. SIO4C5]|nr:hypothetical protein [Leptolyngbya sp. SIO4C5]
MKRFPRKPDRLFLLPLEIVSLKSATLGCLVIIGLLALVSALAIAAGGGLAVFNIITKRLPKK